jgi:hypothetical protein
MTKAELKALHQDAQVGLQVLADEIHATAVDRPPEKTDLVTIAITKIEAALHELNALSAGPD